MEYNADTVRHNVKSTTAQINALTSWYIFNLMIGMNMSIRELFIGVRKRYFNSPYGPYIGVPWMGVQSLNAFPVAGCVLACVAQNRFGYRPCMMAANAVQLAIGATTLCFLNYYYHSAGALYLLSALAGFNTGFATGFVATYSAEICEPKLRSALTSVAGLFHFFGFLYVTILGWTVASPALYTFLFVAVPLANTVVWLDRTAPESPMWLLSKGNVDEARRVFKKIRGGAGEEIIATEFREMASYVDATKPNDSNACYYERTQSTSTGKGLMKPLLLVLPFIFMSNVLSGVPLNPHLEHYVYENLKTPVDPEWLTKIAYTAVCVIGNSITILSINSLGKRFLVLSATAACAVCYLSIGIAGHLWPASSVSSWTRMTLFFASTMFSSVGIQPVTWILVSEIFPMKSRSAGAALSITVHFVLTFLMTHISTDLKTLFDFYNMFVMTGVVGLVGLLFFYFLLPETENKTLNAISKQFQNKLTKTVDF